MFSAYTEYNVGYRDQSGNLRLAFVTWGIKEIALKRLAKMQKQGGCVRWIDNPGGGWGSEKTEALLVARHISAPEVVEP